MNMAKISITDELLNGYLANTATPDQQEAVEAWYLQSEENRKRLEQYYFLTQLNTCTQAAAHVDAERSLRELHTRIRRRKSFGMIRPMRRFAAAVAVILIFAGGWWGAERMVAGFSPAFTIHTDAGERTHATLPDGTQVWLNSCTELTYSSPLLGGERRVELRGEAYFEVTKNRPRIFVVRSEGLRTEVLGTRFNIRANADDPAVTATLFEGSIRATACRDGHCDHLLLKPGQQVSLDHLSGRMTLSEADVDHRIDWLNNSLRFRQQTLREIVRELERHYNVTITIEDDSLAEKRFSGEFDATSGIRQILSVLQLAGKFSYRMSGSQIILSAQP